jgi:hypothetical protein
MSSSPEINMAREFSAKAPHLLRLSPAFKSLAPATQQALLRDLRKINQSLAAPAASHAADPYAFSLDTPDDFSRHRRFPGQPEDPSASGGSSDGQQPQPDAAQPSTAPAADPGASVAGPKAPATQTLASRVGALSDEINFPAFVASLVHGTFDAIVDATIRQMEAFADLVSAVAKDVDKFTEENVTENQAKDWLVKQHPQDLQLAVADGQPALQPRVSPDAQENAPAWLDDYGLGGQLLSTDFIDQQLVPVARKRVGQNRLQTLATMVLLGMNRVVVRDGTISARIQIRAQASDTAKVDYAVSNDPGGQTWAERGSSVYPQPGLMVSTISANVQTDTQLRADLYGEVRINFASETLPLERFADPARLALLQRNARSNATSAQPAETPPAPAPAPLTAPIVPVASAAPPSAPASAAPPAPAASIPATAPVASRGGAGAAGTAGSPRQGAGTEGR